MLGIACVDTPPPPSGYSPAKTPREKASVFSPSREAWGSTPKGGGGVCSGRSVRADHENEGEGKFPSGLQASMRSCEECSGFGLEPDLETQRFWPDLHGCSLIPCFSQGRSTRARTRRGARVEPASPNRLDLQNPGASCYSTEAAEVLVLLGRTLGSRRYPLL
jgi:hypothetical protein